MADKVRAAAEAEGVKFYIMYDVSDWTTMQTGIKADWTGKMRAHTASSAYARQSGKPVDAAGRRARGDPIEEVVDQGSREVLGHGIIGVAGAQLSGQIRSDVSIDGWFHAGCWAGPARARGRPQFALGGALAWAVGAETELSAWNDEMALLPRDLHRILGLTTCLGIPQTCRGR